jgi:large subunit ribosomal protein L29
MRVSEVRDIRDEELAVKERELRESLFLLRLKHGTNQLDSPARLRSTRRDLARIKTIQRERALRGTR